MPISSNGGFGEGGFGEVGFGPPPPPGQTALIQSAIAGPNVGNNLSLQYSSPVAQGDLLVVLIFNSYNVSSNPAVYSVSDDQGNVYTQATSNQVPATTGAGGAVYWAVASGTNIPTVTASFGSSSGVNLIGMAVLEYPPAASPVVNQTGAYANPLAATTEITTTTSNLAVVALGIGTSGTFSGGGWTPRASWVTGSLCAQWSDQLVSASGTSVMGTEVGNPSYYQMVILVAFTISTAVIYSDKVGFGVVAGDSHNPFSVIAPAVAFGSTVSDQNAGSGTNGLAVPIGVLATIIDNTLATFAGATTFNQQLGTLLTPSFNSSAAFALGFSQVFSEQLLLTGAGVITFGSGMSIQLSVSYDAAAVVKLAELLGVTTDAAKIFADAVSFGVLLGVTTVAGKGLSDAISMGIVASLQSNLGLTMNGPLAAGMVVGVANSPAATLSGILQLAVACGNNTSMTLAAGALLGLAVGMSLRQSPVVQTTGTVHLAVLLKAIADIPTGITPGLASIIVSLLSGTSSISLSPNASVSDKLVGGGQESDL